MNNKIHSIIKGARRCLVGTTYLFFVTLTLLSDAKNDVNDHFSKSLNKITGKNPMMTLTLSTNQTNYILGEAVRVTVIVINSSHNSIDILDFPNVNDSTFYFELTHTNNKKTETFTFFESIDPNSPATVKHTHTVQSNGRYWGSANLSRIEGLSLKGSYSLTATLIVNGKPITSAPLNFSVGGENIHQIASLATGLIIRGNKSDGELAFVQKNNQENTVYRQQFYETLHVGEVGVRALMPLYATTEDIDEVFIPENSGHVMGEMFRWTVWRSQNTIYAFLDTQTEPVKWQAPETVGYLIPKVNKVSGGPLQILAVSEKGDTIWLLHAETDKDGEKTSLKLQWQTQSDELLSLKSLTAVIPPEGINGGHYLLGIEQSQPGSYSIHAAEFNSQKLNTFRKIPINNGEFFDKVPLVAKIDELNNLNIATVTISKEANGERNLLLTESVFSNDGSIKMTRRDKIEGVDIEDIDSGALIYSRVESEFERLDLVLSPESGELLKVVESKAEPVAVFGDATSPIQLFSADDSTYVLYFLPEKGYYFEAI